MLIITGNGCKSNLVIFNDSCTSKIKNETFDFAHCMNSLIFLINNNHCVYQGEINGLMLVIGLKIGNMKKFQECLEFLLIQLFITKF